MITTINERIKSTSLEITFSMLFGVWTVLGPKWLPDLFPDLPGPPQASILEPTCYDLGSPRGRKSMKKSFQSGTVAGRPKLNGYLFEKCGCSSPKSLGCRRSMIFRQFRSHVPSKSNHDVDEICMYHQILICPLNPPDDSL